MRAHCGQVADSYGDKWRQANISYWVYGKLFWMLIRMRMHMKGDAAVFMFVKLAVQSDKDEVQIFPWICDLLKDKNLGCSNSMI